MPSTPPNFVMDWDTSFYPVLDSGVTWGSSTFSLEKNSQSWELLYRKDREVEEETVSETHDLLDALKEEERLQKEMREHSLVELARILPSATLGLHTVNGVPYNLIFRAEKTFDPRKKEILEHGWFEVKGNTDVLWAAATLENYNILDDTGMEFSLSKRADQWLEYIQSTDPLPIGEYFVEDTPLFDYQKEAVQFLVRRKRAMCSLSPGLGKTLVSAYASGVAEQHSRILLVCPASLLHYWRAELLKWQDVLPMQPLPIVWHKRDLPEEQPLLEGQQLWMITNPETLVKKSVELITRDRYDLMIVDESIMYKHRGSRRSKKLAEVAKQIENVWFLTGAPATRYLDDMWHQFHILNPRGNSSYWRFARRYCVVDDNQWGSSVVANKRDAEEKIKENFADIYFTRSQDEVTDIPPWLFEDVDVPMDTKQEAVYDKLQKELLIKLEPFEDNVVMRATNHLSLVVRSIQVASNPILVGSHNSSGKWAVLEELMDVYPSPYIVWVNFIRTGEMLQEALRGRFSKEGKQVGLLNGSTPMEDRNKLVESFQRGEMGAIILNNAVGKFGFNLTRARTSFFVERIYDDSYFQCLHRNRRIGTTQSPVVVNMRSVYSDGYSTIDHVIHDTIDYRTGMIRKLTVGDFRKLKR